MNWPGPIIDKALQQSVDRDVIDKFEKIKILVDTDTRIYLYKDGNKEELKSEFLHGTNKISEVCNIIIYLMTNEFVDINENTVGTRLNLLRDLFNTCSKKLKSNKNYKKDKLFVSKVRHTIRFSMYPYFYSKKMLSGLQLKNHEPNKENLTKCNELWKKYGGIKGTPKLKLVRRGNWMKYL